VVEPLMVIDPAQAQLRVRQINAVANTNMLFVFIRFPPCHA
jgi:hypothetical protein